MSREPFRRLALMVACSVWVAAIAAAWIYLDWIVAAAAIFGGTIVAAVLTVEPSPPKEPREELRSELARGLTIREIERRARAARVDADDAA